MQELVKQDLPYAREFLPRQQGLERFKSEGDFMKCHFIEQFTAPDEKISIIPHRQVHRLLPRAAHPVHRAHQGVQAAQHRRRVLAGRRKESAAAAYLRHLVFFKKDLDDYLHKVEEAKKRDHRVLGKQLDLFSIQELAGPGLIFWHPKGGLIRKRWKTGCATST
jgi:threonyl-tRNA synthetase